jgi:23S rRNA (guanosine2251-2'-O)-methyltransferase
MKAKSSLIFGLHPVSEAIRSGKAIDKILIKHGFRSESVAGLFQDMQKHSIPYQYVPVEKLNRMTQKSHQGIIALTSEVEYTDLGQLVPMLFEQGRLPAFVVLDGITDVRNLGAIARSALCSDFDGMIIPTKGSAQINADAIKTSAGALSSLPVCREPSLTETITFLKACGFMIYAATEKASDHLYQADFKKPIALIMGAEDSGIEPRLLKMADMQIKVPMFGSISSLNVSAAATVLFYEVVRQRHF